MYLASVKVKKLLAILVFVPGLCLGQDHLKNFSLEGGLRSVTIPFELSSNLIIIPILINGRAPLHMVFDTGVKTAILTELISSDTLQFTYSQVQVLRGLGEGRSIIAYPSYGNSISLDGLSGRNQDIYVLGQNDINLSMRLGTPVNGLIGHDLFADFIVEIDYIDQEITFNDPETYTVRNDRRSVTLPLEIVNGKPYLRANIVQDDGRHTEVRLLIDTGGGFALWLSSGRDDSLISIPEKVQRSYLGYGLGGEILGSIGHIPELLIGPYTFTMPTTAFPDSGAVQQVLREDARHGSIGAEILRRFDITMNYGDSSITFRPNSSFSDDFTYNRSGIEVIAPVPGVKSYFVSRVQAGSPAGFAGIRVHDQVLQVNLRVANECTMDDLNAYFHGKHGERIRIRLLRNGEKITLKFNLGG